MTPLQLTQFLLVFEVGKTNHPWVQPSFTECILTILQCYPDALAGMAMNSVRDLTKGYGFDSNRPNHIPELPLSSGHMITFKASKEDELEGSVVLTIRCEAICYCRSW